MLARFVSRFIGHAQDMQGQAHQFAGRRLGIDFEIIHGERWIGGKILFACVQQSIEGIARQVVVAHGAAQGEGDLGSLGWLPVIDLGEPVSPPLQPDLAHDRFADRLPDARHFEVEGVKREQSLAPLRWREQGGQKPITIGIAHLLRAVGKLRSFGHDGSITRGELNEEASRTMDANDSLRESVPRRREDAGANEFLFIPMRFLPQRTKPAIDALARLGCVAREIADSTERAPSDRIALLNGLTALLDGNEPGVAMDPVVVQAVRDFTAAADAIGGDARHAHHILQARVQDVGKSRYRDWNELLAYCRYAASPYGRFGLDICGADKAVQPAVEALCCALYILLLLRDCGSDNRHHGRVYLPERWFKETGADVSALGADCADGPLRQVFTKILEATDRLLLTARPLPGLLRDRRQRAAAAATLCLAERFARRLRSGDPLAQRLAPTRGDQLFAVWRGHLAAMWR